MTYEVRIVLALIGFGALGGAVYLAMLMIAQRREQRRRKAGETRIAARIYAPRCRSPLGRNGRDPSPALRAAHDLAGLLHEQPLFAPFVTGVLLGGVVLIAMVDPIMDDPLLWPTTWKGLRSLPGWMKALWLALAILLCLGIPLVMFSLPRKRFSRQWLVLHADGRMTAIGADFPAFDPERPFHASRRIWSTSLSAWHGVLIVQDRVHLAIVLAPVPHVWQRWLPHVRDLVPPDAYAVRVGLEDGPVSAHLIRHFPETLDATS